MASSTPSTGQGDRRWRSDVAYIGLGIAVGAAALYIGLITLLLGLIPIAIGARYVWRGAGTHRLAFAGAILVGIGLPAWPVLGQAVTNHDPAVRYASSTVPLLIAALALGAIGAVTVVAGTVSGRTRRVA